MLATFCSGSPRHSETVTVANQSATLLVTVHILWKGIVGAIKLILVYCRAIFKH